MTEVLSQPTNVQIRKLDGGATVVDYGMTWFRINPDGSVIRKDAYAHGVSKRPATAAEILKVTEAAKAGS
jgi:hypothetical protein